MEAEEKQTKVLHEGSSVNTFTFPSEDGATIEVCFENEKGVVKVSLVKGDSHMVMSGGDLSIIMSCAKASGINETKVNN